MLNGGPSLKRSQPSGGLGRHSLGQGEDGLGIKTNSVTNKVRNSYMCSSHGCGNSTAKAERTAATLITTIVATPRQQQQQQQTEALEGTSAQPHNEQNTNTDARVP